jgi:hypothetical protein
MLYVVAVALIWIAASFLVQSVVDSGVSPFLITYICNSLFLVYIPVVEIGRVLQRLLMKGAAVDGSAGLHAPAPGEVPAALKESETQTLLEPPEEAASDQALLEANGSPLVSDDHGMYFTTTTQTFLS